MMKKRDMLAIVVGVSILVFIGNQVIFFEADAKKYYKKNQHENGEFAWDHKITDGVLTYMVLENNDLMFKKMVDSAVLEWEEALGEVLVFEKIKYGEADITFDEVSQRSLGKTDVNSKDGNTMQDVGGATKIMGNEDMGTITHISIRVAALDDRLQEFAIVRHETGHALGLFEHNKNPKSVMYSHTTPTDYRQQKITQCDALTVVWINYLDDGNTSNKKKKGCY